MLGKQAKELSAWIRRRRLWVVIGVGGAVIAAGGLLLFIAAVETPDETMRVAFLDVGQGDAVFIEAPNGRQMVIDGGPSRRVVRELGAVMPFWDRSIDLVLATHPDKDHMGGLIDVLAAYDVSAVLRGGTRTDTDIFDYWRRRIEPADVEERVVYAGQTVRLSPRVHFDVLFPPRAVNTREMEPNNGSVVGRLVYGDTAFLLSGDAPVAVEKYLARTYQGNLESEVLKVGHHGSDTSTSRPWLGWSDPQWAVISAGKDNRHGHPAPSVVERLKRFDIEILQTKKRGTMVFESDGERVKLLQ